VPLPADDLRHQLEAAIGGVVRERRIRPTFSC
jgi:hypothetical protein